MMRRITNLSWIIFSLLSIFILQNKLFGHGMSVFSNIKINTSNICFESKKNISIDSFNCLKTENSPTSTDYIYDWVETEKNDNFLMNPLTVFSNKWNLDDNKIVKVADKSEKANLFASEPTMILAGTTCTVSPTSTSICLGSSINISFTTSNVGTSGVLTGTAQYTTDGGVTWNTLTKNTTVTNSYTPTQTTIYGTRVLGYLGNVECGPSFTTITVNPIPGVTTVSGGGGPYCASTTLTANGPCSGTQDFGSGTSTSNTYPLYSYYNYSRSASLILRNEVSCNPGSITHLAVYVGTSGSHTFTGITIRLKKTTATTCPTAFPGDGTLVYTGSYTFSSTGWVTFDITDFNWDSDNLLIEWQHGYTSYTSYYPYFRYTTQGSNLQTYASSDGALPTTGTNTTNRTNYRLTFASSTTYWESTTNNGTNTATPSTSQSVSLTGTYYFRARTDAGCWGAQGGASVTIDPTSAANETQSPASGSSVCAGASITYTGSGTGTFQRHDYQWNGTGGAWSTYSASNPASWTATTGTLYMRSVYKSGVCPEVASSPVVVTVVADPSAPTATKSPASTTVCAGTTLTLSSPTSGGGGTGTCNFEYQYNTGSGYSAWSTTVPSFAAVVGTNNIRIRSNCNGSGCDVSGYSEYSWAVDATTVAGTVTQTPASGGSVCTGGNVNYSYSGGTGTFQYFEYQWNGTGGAYSGSWGTTNPFDWTSGLNGASVLYVRANVKNGVCAAATTSPVNVTVIADPLAPTATKSPIDATVCAGSTLTLSSPTSGGGGSGTCNFEYQYNTGSGYSSWSTTVPSFSAVVGVNYIRIRRNCNGTGCDISGYTEYSWTVVADPVAQTVTGTPVSGTDICLGGSVSASVSGGSGGTGTVTNEYQYSTDGGTGWSSYTPSNSVTSVSTGSNRVQIRTRRTASGSGCDASGYNTAQWTVVADPVAQTVTGTPVTGTDICLGGSVSASVSGGSGGTGTVTDEYQYSTNGGTGWSSYTPGNNVISVSTGSNRVQIRTRRTASGTGCDATGYNTAQWTVVADPVAQTVTGTPVSGTDICLGGSVSAGVSGGSGGIGTVTDEYQYSTDGGSGWSSYTPSNSVTSVSTGSNRVQIRTRRTASGTGCDASEYNTAEWSVVADPVAPTASKSPNEELVCTGEILKLLGLIDNGGGSGACNIEYRYSINNGTSWTSWSTTPSSFEAESGYNIIEIRKSCSGNGCGISSSSQYSWLVNDAPTAPTSITGTTTICNGSTTTLSASGGSEGSGCTYQWGSGSNVGSNIIGTATSDSYTTSSLSSNTTYWVRRVGNTGCTNTTGGETQLVTVSNAPTAPTGISGTTTVPLGQSTTLTATGGSEGSACTYEWFEGGCGSGLTLGTNASITVSPLVNTTYYVRRLGENPCLNTTLCANVLVNVTTSSSTWTGALTTDWNTAGNWSPASVPNASNNAIIPNVSRKPIINLAKATPAQCNNLTINAGSSVTISSGKALTVNGNLVNNGTITIKSNATDDGSLIVIGSRSGGGTTKIEKYLSSGKWHLISSPITNGISAIFQGLWLRTYDETMNRYGDYITSTSQPLTPGQGFSVWSNSNVTKVFSGTINHGDIGPINLKLTGAPSTTTGWNLIGNPYPSAIDWDAPAGWTKNNVANAVYVWNQSQYATYVAGVGQFGGSKNIAIGQGFLVQATNINSSVTIKNGAKIHSTSAFLKNDDNANLIRVNVFSQNYSDETVIAIRNAASDDFDVNYDAIKLYGSYSAPQMYTYKENNDDILAINSQNSISKVYGMIINIEYAEWGEHFLVYNHTLDINNIPVLFDHVTQTIVTPNIPYQYIASPNDPKNRFQFIEPMNTSIVNQNASSVMVWENENILHIGNLSLEKLKTVNVYDVQGKMVYFGSETIVDLNHLKPGTYVARVTTDIQTIVKKITIK